MEFRKYNSIENSYREQIIDRIRLQGLNKIAWAATEKIHGANFSFWTDGEEVRVASRTQFVDGTFYSCQEVIDRYTPDVLALWENYFSGAALENTLTVYGELFGEGIQKGIRYGSGKDFRVFDIAVNGNPIPPVHARGCVEEMCDQLKFVPVVHVFDSLNDALQADPHYETLVGRERGIDDPANSSEGFVLVPWETVAYIGDSRVILKNKDERWKERSSKPKVPRKAAPDAKYLDLIAEFVTVPRLDAVLSKRDQVTLKQFGEVIRDMCSDVLEDMVRDQVVPADWRQLDDYANLGKEINQVVVPFLKRELLTRL